MTPDDLLDESMELLLDVEEALRQDHKYANGDLYGRVDKMITQIADHFEAGFSAPEVTTAPEEDK
jgi:hypothetical protein